MQLIILKNPNTTTWYIITKFMKHVEKENQERT